MAVKNAGGMVLDLQTAREQLSKDRDAGRISNRDYKKASKGLNRMIDAEKKGVSYQFTGEGRFRTDSSSGQNVSRRDGGIGINDKIALSGTNVSKAMGYLQSKGLTVPKADEAPEAANNPTAPQEKPKTGSSPAIGMPAFNALAGTAFAGANGAFLASRAGNTGGTGTGTPQAPQRDEEPFIKDAEAAIARTKKQEGEKVDNSALSDEYKKIQDEIRDIQSKMEELRPLKGNPVTSAVSSVLKPLHQNKAIDLFTPTRASNQFAEKLNELQRRAGEIRGKLKGTQFDTGDATEDFSPQNLVIGQDEADNIALQNSYIPFDAPFIGSYAKAAAVKPAQKLLNAPQLQLPPPAANAGQFAGNWQANRQFVGGTKGTAGRAMANAENISTVRPQFSAADITREAQQKASAIVGRIREYGKKTGWNVRSKTPMKKHGGKIRKFAGGGFVLDGALAANRYIENMKRRNPDFATDNRINSLVSSSRPGFPALKMNLPKTGISTARPEQEQYANRRTSGVRTDRIQGARNENSRPIDKDSLINNAMGAFGAASLLTAKRPKLERANRFSMAIRPATGDEGMVSRSFNKIDQATRAGAGQLRNRTGSDLTSYVQGVTAMTDNAAKAKSDVLGANAQMKRQDENRMFGEMNQERQINLNLDEANRRESNIQNEQMYLNRVQGAQAALNNSMNFGVQKRANQTNNQIQLNMANKRLEMMLLSEASRMKSSGTYTDEQIEEWKQNMRQAARSYANGGRISDSTRMKIANNSDISRANKQLMDIFKEYKKLVSQASVESIRQFNANIRAINQRNNITITRR